MAQIAFNTKLFTAVAAGMSVEEANRAGTGRFASPYRAMQFLNY
jgi:hypothetical protein